MIMDGDQSTKQVRCNNVKGEYDIQKNVQSTSHETICMKARAGMPRVIEFLLDNGVDISSTTRSGDTALTLALQNFDASHPVVKLLQKNSEGNQSQPDEEAA